MLYVEVIGDVNDGDYTSNLSLLADEDLQKLKDAVALIVKFNESHPYEHNYPNHDHNDMVAFNFYKKHGMTDDQFELLNELVPHLCDTPIHSIKEVVVYKVTDVDSLL